jgi:hypothetical protein
MFGVLGHFFEDQKVTIADWIAPTRGWSHS